MPTITNAIFMLFFDTTVSLNEGVSVGINAYSLHETM